MGDKHETAPQTLGRAKALFWHRSNLETTWSKRNLHLFKKHFRIAAVEFLCAPRGMKQFHAVRIISLYKDRKCKYAVPTLISL